MEYEDMQLAVKRGAYYLDEQYPNWASVIKLDELEMDDCEQCVIGQAVGEYGTAIAKAAGCQPYSRASNEWAIDHGFDVCFEAYEADGDAYDMEISGSSHVLEQYRSLEGLWTEQVKERLGQ